MKKILSILFLLLVAPAVSHACPFCNISGLSARNFLLTVMGLAILGFVCFLLWSWSAGHYHDVEKPKHRILQIDQETKVKP